MCEDYPCCGHERGDCEGGLYGSDESIKRQVQDAWSNGHGMCEHSEGLYNCEGDDECDGDCGDDSDCDECYVSISDRVGN